MQAIVRGDHVRICCGKHRGVTGNVIATAGHFVYVVCDYSIATMGNLQVRVWEVKHTARSAKP